MPPQKWTTGSAGHFSQSRSRKWHVTGKLVSLRTAKHLADIEGSTHIVLSRPLRRLKRPHIAPKQLPTTKPDVTLSLEDPVTHEATMDITDTLFYLPTNSKKPMYERRPTPNTPPRPVTPLFHTSSTTVSLSKKGALMLHTPASHIVLPPPIYTNGLLQTSWTHSRGRHKTFGGAVEHWQCALGKRPFGGAWWEWVGVGRCPTWVGGGDCVTVLRGVPARERGLDRKLKDWMREWRRLVKTGELAQRRKLFGVL